MSHKRKEEDKKRLKKVYEETKNGYGPGVWFDDKKRRYVRLDFTNKWLKTHTTRIIRRKLKNEHCFFEKSLYKKYYDYWWELF